MEALSICEESASIIYQEFWCISAERTLSPRAKGHVGSIRHVSVPRFIRSQCPCRNPKSRTVSHILATITRSPLYPTSARQTLHGLQARNDPHLSKHSKDSILRAMFVWSETDRFYGKFTGTVALHVPAQVTKLGGRSD